MLIRHQALMEFIPLYLNTVLMQRCTRESEFEVLLEDYIQSVNNLCNLFTSIVSTHANAPTWLIGDLNLPNIDWVNNCTQGSACDTVLNFVQEYGFSVKFLTRENSTLDVFITNRPFLIHSCEPIAGISDHEAIYVESSVTLTYQQYTQKKSFLWHKTDMIAIKRIINLFNETFLSKHSLSTPVEVLWIEFKQMCFNCLSHVPISRSSTCSKQPWVTSHIRHLS